MITGVTRDGDGGGSVFRGRRIAMIRGARRDPLSAVLLLLILAGAAGVPGVAGATGDSDRDFPPLVDPNRPAPRETGPIPPVEASPAPAESAAAAEPDIYRLGVGDEVEVSVLSQPQLSGVVKVRPDGAITTPGAGTVHALGRTPEEVGAEIERRLTAILRHPHVDLLVTDFGEQRIFVMGEVELPGDKPYYKGISALQAVAQAGGISSTGQRGSVLVLRRTGQDEAEIHQLDLRPALGGRGPGTDLVLRPYDIVYVPRTFISDLNIFVDQYFAKMIPPFTLYLEGWKAFNIGTDKVRVTVTP